MKLAYLICSCSFICGPMISGGKVYGLIEQKIDEKRLLEVTFSKRSHNRISVAGGQIAKIHGDGNAFSIMIDETTGNAFINLKKDMSDKGTTLTVITNTGSIQDLAVLSCEGPSEHLVLKEDEDLSEEIAVRHPEYYHTTTVDLLNSILEGKVPFGYGQRVLVDTDVISLPFPLAMRALKAFEGPFEEILVYEIQNTGKKQVIITPNSLKKDSNLWVFLNANQLEQKQKALCLIAYPKRGG